jgi:hypothetical protein
MKLSKERWSEIEQTALIVGEGREAEMYKLDFTQASIARLDSMIDDLWEGEAPQNLEMMVWVFGSYIALIVNRTFDGEWTTRKGSREITFESATSGVAFNPWNWVAKRFELDDPLAPKASMIFNMIKVDNKTVQRI